LVPFWMVFLGVLTNAQPAPEASGDLAPVIAQLAWHRLDVSFDFTVQRGERSPLRKAMRVLAQDAPEGQRLLATFTYPANMQGTSFLALTDREAADDEYFLYVRTLRRVKRVPSSAENFMLRDFLSLYFLKPRPELWRFERAPGGPAADGSVVVVATPAHARTEELTGYARLEHVVDPARRVVTATRFYDDRGSLVRRQEVLEHRQIEGVWLPWRFLTDDLREGVKATVEVRSLDLAPDLADDTFTVRHLKRL